MSGIDAQRGFIYQSIIAMMECLERDDWDAVKVEPQTDNDKVDIQLYKKGVILTAIQVKSTKGSFSKPEVERWLSTLKTDATEAKDISLCLVGDSYSSECERFISQNREEIKKITFINLKEICSGMLTEYVKKANLARDVRISDLELIDDSIFAKIHWNSISSKPLTRIAFEEAFRRALPIHGLPMCLTDYVPIGPEIGLIGREEILNKVRVILDSEKSVALISGLGGIGKTAVMQQICNSIMSDEKDEIHVAWITCGDNYIDDFLILRQSFGISKELGREEAFEEVIRELKNISGMLYLFLDNMDRIPGNKELGILNTLRPNVRIMITSRHEIRGVPHINLEELESVPALDMFYNYYGKDEKREYEEDAKRIINADSVKRHTLLMELLAKAANMDFGNLSDFRRKLEDRGFFEVSEYSIDTSHDENLTIEESVMKLYDMSNLSGEQKRIMSLFSILTPEKTIYHKVCEWAGFNANDVNGLVKLGWLVRNENGFVIHQIIKDSLSRQVGDSLKIEEYGGLFENVNNINSYMPRDLEYIKVQERIVLTQDIAKHLYAKTKTLKENGIYLDRDKEILVNSASLFNSLAMVYDNQGEFEKALEYYFQALEILERVLGTEDPFTATTYDCIAGVYSVQGEYEKALKYYKKALRVRECVLGTRNIDTGVTYNNIGTLHYYQGEYEKALEFYLKALEIFVNVYGIDHPELAATYDNIGSAYFTRGEYENAIYYYKKAIIIRKREFGEEHFLLAKAYNNIASVFLKQGKHENALEYYRKALEIRKRVLSPDHPDIAGTYNNMGKLNKAMGKLENALECYEKAFNVFMEKLGENHFYTQNAKLAIESIKQLLINQE